LTPAERLGFDRRFGRKTLREHQASQTEICAGASSQRRPPTIRWSPSYNASGPILFIGDVKTVFDGGQQCLVVAALSYFIATKSSII
jgi:hypothetical protein